MRRSLFCAALSVLLLLPSPIISFAGSTCATGGTCKIGDIGPGGGKVFYVSPDLQPWGRYIEVAADGWYQNRTDLEVAEFCPAKSDMFTFVAKTSFAIGAGKANTESLIMACPQGAASRAKSYQGGGFADWFLPSKDELSEIQWSQRTTNITTVSNYYWSSSMNPEGTLPVALFWPFNSFGNMQKVRLNTYIRPVRYFGTTLDVQILNDKIAAEKAAAAERAAAELKAKQEAEAKAAAELKAKREAEAAALAAAAKSKKTTITCVKGKLTKKVRAIKPKCPKGYKKK